MSDFFLIDFCKNIFFKISKKWCGMILLLFFIIFFINIPPAYTIFPITPPENMSPSLILSAPLHNISYVFVSYYGATITYDFYKSSSYSLLS
jgi:hypothetical protein